MQFAILDDRLNVIMLGGNFAHRRHGAVFQLVDAARSGTAVIGGDRVHKVQTAVPLAQIGPAFAVRRHTVQLFHIAGGGIVQDVFDFGILPNRGKGAVHAGHLGQLGRAVHPLQQPAAIDTPADQVGLSRHGNFGHFTGRTVQPGQSSYKHSLSLFAVHGGVIVPGRGEVPLQRLGLHAAGAGIHDATRILYPAVLGGFFAKIKLDRIAPVGGRVDPALRLELRRLFLFCGGRVGLQHRERVGGGAFVPHAVYIIIAIVTIQLPDASLQNAVAQPSGGRCLAGARRGGFPALGGHFGGYFRGLGGRRLGGLRSAGGESQGQGQQAGNGFFHRVFSFRVCIYLIYLPVYISIGV